MVRREIVISSALFCVSYGGIVRSVPLIEYRAVTVEFGGFYGGDFYGGKVSSRF